MRATFKPVASSTSSLTRWVMLWVMVEMFRPNPTLMCRAMTSLPPSCVTVTPFGGRLPVRRALRTTLSAQAGEVVVRQGDMSIGIDLGDHLRSSFTGLAAAKAVAARYESLAIIHLFSPLEQRFQRNLFCGADLTFHSQSLQAKRIYWLQKYDNIAKGVQLKA